jgi:Tol biopolymer transport system component/DNA-binding winged helix-turn-helix (wHTH) protein
MAEPNRAAATIRFGAFEVNLRTGELRKSGVRIKLQEQPFKVLASLLEDPGEMVSREELRRRIWPEEEFGDFDHAVNLAVAKLRTALGDSAEQPRFVETLPRRGYRFIGEIASPAPGTPLRASAEPVRPTRSRFPLVIAAGLLVGLLFALAAVFVHRWSRPRPAPPTLTALPFTALPGLETSPAFSPDGSRIVFAWNGDPALGTKGFDLYVKAIGSETLLRLTQHPSEWISSAWSPDGTQIAFHRMAGVDTGLYLVPALGGPERKLHSTHVPYSVAAPISWSPDGKWIAFSDPLPGEPKDRIHLLAVDNLETREFSHNPRCLHEAVPTFSHNGDQLAYVCVRSMNEFELYSVSPFGGTPKLITAFSNGPTAIAWSADDSRLIFSQASEDGPELDEVKLRDGSMRRLDFAENAEWPAASPKGDKLAYSSPFGNSSLWRMDLRHPQSPAIELIRSTQGHEDAQYSPDGQHIAFVSSRAGSWDIWMSDADGTNLVQLSKPISNASTPRWSPDGKRIAFDSRQPGNREVYVVDVSERVPRKLVTSIRNISTPSWSRDGKWIYFRSYDALGEKISRCSATGGNAVALGGQPDGTFPQELFDGTVLYFADRPANTGLREISLQGAFPESTVEGVPPILSANLWAIVQGGIYFVPADAPRSLRYFNFASSKVSEIFRLDKDFAQGLSVSPDGRWLLYSQLDEEYSDIMLVDHFNKH